ncbi:DUF2784 domain-containing protein [Thermodesulfobacteriota bacterium]
MKTKLFGDQIFSKRGNLNLGYNKYVFAADVILLMHFAFVVFVVFGFVFIWIGHYFKLKSVKNAKFRIYHILSMGFVLCESLIGTICPLTEWENEIRLQGGQSQIYETSFVKDWVHKIMFFDFSERTFTIIYIFFFALMLLTFWIIPPKIDLKRK